MIPLHTPLARLGGVGPQLAARLARLGLHTVHDALWHLPTRYEDYSEIVPIGDLGTGMQATIIATVREIETRRAWKHKHLVITTAMLEDESGSITATWFNQPYIEKALGVGTNGSFAGKIALRGGELTIQNPAYERVTQQLLAQRNTSRLVPIYPETYGLTSRGLRYIIMPILQQLDDLPDPLPADLIATYDYPTLNEALRSIHFPDTIEAAERARERLHFEELVLLQLRNEREKAALAREAAVALPENIPLVKKLLEQLPFTLTAGQKQALWDVVRDTAQPHPMNRLVQGDVGSGKTIVAVIASLLATEAGVQCAIMAPTDVLARQHYATYAKLLPILAPHLTKAPTIALLTGSAAHLLYPEGLEAVSTAAKVRAQLARGTVHIGIGTHALITKATTFHKLGLVVIDEQHRFGVAQRKALVGARKRVPHFLSMSATPIPRTIMMTAFGDLSPSIINELPANRQPVTTVIIGSHERTVAYDRIETEVAAGRQAFIICPLVKAAEPLEHGKRYTVAQQIARERLAEATTATEEHARLARDVFPQRRLGLLHGALKAAEKEAVMKRFNAGTYDILVATSVIEVGVDVPNATVLLVENAERFGLAQLYQFRGRVGRGTHAAYCFLATEAAEPPARLTALLKAKNGFELAEYDLKLRGPGQFLGEAQSGLPDTVMQHMTDTRLITTSANAARTILVGDPTLAAHPLLHERLTLFEKRLHLE